MMRYSLSLWFGASFFLVSSLGTAIFAQSTDDLGKNEGEPGTSPAAEKLRDPKEPYAHFGFSHLRDRAADIASRPYEEPITELPEELSNLTYDEYRDIRFRANHALWGDQELPFEVQFFLRGFHYSKRVLINVVDDNGVMLVPFTNDLFNFGKNNITKALPTDLGFAGFRLHYPLNNEFYHDELAVFLGASYFRAVGRGQGYGLSMRGLAVDTGLNKPEEFPFFREFWLAKPKAGEKRMTLYALLDGPSSVGAYRMVIKPGKSTSIDVKAMLFMRHGVQRLGVAPLTSMFLYGENEDSPVDDFRPEIHDSDGLLIHTGSGEWIWRPLHNPRRLRISSFLDSNPKGFGLLQRDREFANYQDLEARYETRPSGWVETVGNWGKGVVQLVEIPSDAEKYDNIVAYWVPEEPTNPGQLVNLDYRITFQTDVRQSPPMAKAVATRTGMGGVSGAFDASKRKFVIDFEGHSLLNLPEEVIVEAVISTSAGKISNVVTQPNEFVDGWRVFFELEPDKSGPVELRCYLKANDKAISETWSYQWERE